MRYPAMQEIPRQTENVEKWYGYDHNPRIQDGSNYDEKNITGDYFPVLAPRRPRGIYARPENCQGLIAKDTLCYVDGSRFVMDGYPYEMGLSEEAQDCPKQLISMGAYVIIMPDKKYFNTADPEDRGEIEARTVTEGEVSFVLCTDDGTGYDGAIESPTEPSGPHDGDYWIDTGRVPNGLYQWSEAESMWVQIGSTYVKISAPGIGRAFKEFDAVTLSGAEAAEDEEIRALMGSQQLWARGDDYIVIIGFLARAQTLEVPITVERVMPYMDYMIECGNRLWGCRYGVARNGEIVNEIYACKLGDFRNWNVFMGISTDCWVGNCGSDGQWTGAINYLGKPVFFKADHIHTVYGSLPSEYRIQDTVARGVQKGSHGSLAMVNEVLLYKSRTGVCRYDGSLPADISEALGQESYTDAVAGGHGNKYYISMLHEGTREPVLMTYDVKAGVWHKEDELRARAWCSARNDMYCINDDTGEIVSVTGAGEPETEPVQWMIVTGEVGLQTNMGYYQVASPEEKRIVKIVVRMALEVGSVVDFAIEYEGSGVWEHLGTIRGKGLRSYTMPIKPRRCDWMRIKITGVGPAKIYSMQKTIEGGSDWNARNGGYLDF